MLPPTQISQSWSRLIGTGTAYLAASGFSVALTRFGGGAAFLWTANAVLLASLVTSPRRQWGGLVALCWFAGTVSSGAWGLGWSVAPLMATINVAEPVLAAVLVVHWKVHRSTLDSTRDLGLFILAAGLLAPLTTGLIGASVITWVSHTSFAHNFGHWYVGHALGALTFMPIFVQVASGELRRWLAGSARGKITETTALLLLVAAVTMGVFVQSQLPMLFLPVLPLMLVTFRVGRIGSAAAVVVITGIGASLTLAGLGPVNLIHAGIGERLLFLQFYLAITVMTVLPVAADLTRRGKLFDRLRDSEARFRLLTENSTDIVLNLDVNGIIRYASPSIALLGGYDPSSLTGTPSVELIHPRDRERVTAVHRQALQHPDRTFSIEYRGLVRDNEPRWFETHTRAVIDEDGIIRGVVSAVRDTSHRREQEAELSRAAHTDALTGICNRRAFDRELRDRLASDSKSTGGCVAVFDLDHFKQINDRFGHAAGDKVLQAFALTAEAQVRGSDMLARIGGEEFGLIFSDVQIEQAEAVCERIRAAVEASEVRIDDCRIAVTVSVGISLFRMGEEPMSVMRKADEALYLSKHQGRNRLSLAA